MWSTPSRGSPLSPSPNSPLQPPSGLPLSAHEQGRADFWALIGALLLQPTVPLLQSLAQSPSPGLSHDGNAALMTAWQALIRSARSLGPEAVRCEHAALFVAVGTPPVDPYASRYLGSFLMDQPLARLRADLRTLGQQRQRGAAHTEDHLGALCESMRLLIAGTASLPRVQLEVQRDFYAAHVLSWAPACLYDIRHADGAHFYAALADLALAFLAVECLAFELDPTFPAERQDAVLATHA